MKWDSFVSGLPRVDLAGLEVEFQRSGLDRLEAREAQLAAARICSMRAARHPQYAEVSSRILRQVIREDLAKVKAKNFSEAMALAGAQGLLSAECIRLVVANAARWNELSKNEGILEDIALWTLMDRYLLKDPTTGLLLESPEYFFLRVAIGLSQDTQEIESAYGLFSERRFLPGTPTLFHSGTPYAQMSSCFVLDSPADTLESIYQVFSEGAQLSKYAGGLGIAFHRVRAHGSPIGKTGSKSRGLIPWLKILDASVAAVNQSGRRKGACCVYLETWHADILAFLELRKSSGPEERRVRHLHLAHWIPDLFMKRVEKDEGWSLFDPKLVPELPDLYGDEFEQAYLRAEKAGLAQQKVSARELYALMLAALAETGNGWINFKDPSNHKSNQTGSTGATIHSSNLCTEILEVNDREHIAVCNLGSVNLSTHLDADGFNFESLKKTVRQAIPLLDRVIDRNAYPLEKAKNSNNRGRPVGLGVMGLQDVFQELGLSFESPEASTLSRQIFETIYFEALTTSAELAVTRGAHASFSRTKASHGLLQFDLWKTNPSAHFDWTGLKEKIKKTGLRNSLLIAVAPTATIATISGCVESIEPQISNLFKRETLSGEFVRLNRRLVELLEARGAWTAETQESIVRQGGSVQHLAALTPLEKNVFKTAWEISAKALIDLAAERAPFICQSQSLNLYMETPSIEKLSSMYHYAWKSGLKTTYYLRSRPASEIAKVTVDCEVCQ